MRTAPVVQRLLKKNSEPLTGARPSVRLCVGPELARCVHSNTYILFKYLFIIQILIYYSNTYLLCRYLFLFIIQILIFIYYSNTYFYLLFKYLFNSKIIILFKYLFNSNNYFIQILFFLIA